MTALVVLGAAKLSDLSRSVGKGLVRGLLTIASRSHTRRARPRPLERTPTTATRTGRSVTSEAAGGATRPFWRRGSARRPRRADKALRGAGLEVRRLCALRGLVCDLAGNAGLGGLSSPAVAR